MKSWSVGGLELEYPIMIGAGVCKTPESVFEYQNLDLPIGAVVGGSYTPLPRAGNTGRMDFWHSEQQWGLNAFGMPNCGFEEADRVFSRMRLHRPFVLSLAGFSVDDYLRGYCLFRHKSYVAAVELNLGCPNTHKNVLPMSYDVASLTHLLRTVSYCNTRTPIWVKLSPYLYLQDIERLSDFVETDAIPTMKPGFVGSVLRVLDRYRSCIRAVVIANTIPNCKLRGTDGVCVTTPNGGQAGLSGSLLKSIVLRQIREFRRALPSSIDVIASGGVLTGDDVVEYFNEGVVAVQCTSLPYFQGGAKAIPSLLSSESLQTLLSTQQ